MSGQFATHQQILPPTKEVFDRNWRISSKKISWQEREDCNKEDDFLFEAESWKGRADSLQERNQLFVKRWFWIGWWTLLSLVLGSLLGIGFDSKLFCQADNYNKRRLRGEEVPVVEYDALIASRKEARLAEGGKPIWHAVILSISHHKRVCFIPKSDARDPSLVTGEIRFAGASSTKALSSLMTGCCAMRMIPKALGWYLHPRSSTARPWKMMTVRLLSLLGPGNFSGEIF